MFRLVLLLVALLSLAATCSEGRQDTESFKATSKLGNPGLCEETSALKRGQLETVAELYSGLDGVNRPICVGLGEINEAVAFAVLGIERQNPASLERETVYTIIQLEEVDGDWSAVGRTTLQRDPEEVAAENQAENAKAVATINAEADSIEVARKLVSKVWPEKTDLALSPDSAKMGLPTFVLSLELNEPMPAGVEFGLEAKVLLGDGREYHYIVTPDELGTAGGTHFEVQLTPDEHVLAEPTSMSSETLASSASVTRAFLTFAGGRVAG